MKYLKKFDTTTEYDQFKVGNTFITPNVSFIVDGGVLLYQKVLTFKIDDVEYVVEKGMTWEEWINSSYNTDGMYYSASENVFRHSIHGKIAFYDDEGWSTTVQPKDIINSNISYFFTTGDLWE